jgi:hypothetical protein
MFQLDELDGAHSGLAATACRWESAEHLPMSLAAQGTPLAQVASATSTATRERVHVAP